MTLTDDRPRVNGRRLPQIGRFSAREGEGSKSDYRVYVPAHVDVKGIRAKLGMTQQSFATRFGFTVNTLRHWEQGKREPEGPTRAYLLVIDRAPQVV